MSAAIPRAELQILDGAGHLVQEDAPEQLVQQLTPFLDDYLGSQGSSST